LLTLHMCDNLFNAMVNPLFIISAGGLTGLNFVFHPAMEYLPRSRRIAPPPPQMPLGSGAAPV
jgi:hypothetical protein